MLDFREVNREEGEGEVCCALWRLLLRGWVNVASNVVARYFVRAGRWAFECVSFGVPVCDR